MLNMQPHPGTEGSWHLTRNERMGLHLVISTKRCLFNCFLVISGKIKPAPIFSVLITQVEEKQSFKFLACIKMIRNSQ